MPITHSKVSAKSDGGDATLVRPSDWNASHVGGDRLWVPGATINAADDEFDDDSLAGAWTDVGPSHSQVWTEASDVLSLLHTGTADTPAGGVFHAKLKAVPGGFAVGNYIEAGVRHMGFSAGYPMVGLMMTNGTAYTNATDYVYANTYSSGTSTTGARYISVRKGKFVTAEGVAVDVAIDTTGDVGLHLRLKWAATNTWDMLISPDAVSWLPVVTGASYTLTPTHIGVAFNSWGVTNRVVTWDYFRVR